MRTKTTLSVFLVSKAGLGKAAPEGSNWQVALAVLETHATSGSQLGFPPRENQDKLIAIEHWIELVQGQPRKLADP